MEKENIFEMIPNNLDEEVFELLEQGDHVKIERIISRGHASPDTGWYDQDHDEWVIVLKGSASLSFKDEAVVELVQGDYLNIPAHTKHRVIRTSATGETLWLAVHY